MRFTPCECDPANHKLVARKWWMRAFRTRHRYRCGACKSVMLLRDTGTRDSHWAFLVLALAAALGGVYVAIGYWENWADAQERRALSRDWE